MSLPLPVPHATRRTAAQARPRRPHHGGPGHALLLSLLFGLLASLVAGCASTAPEDAERLARSGRYEEARARLAQALREQPDNPALRNAHARTLDHIVVLALSQAELALAAGRLDEAALLAGRAQALDASHPRLAALHSQLDQARAAQRRLVAERSAAAAAAERARAAALQPAPPPPALAAAYQKPVSLEFREAPLRQVFEVLSRSTAINFVFDKDVRGDSKVTVFLRNVTLDEAMRVILATQQLDRKLLNDSTVLIYPNTAAKQREHQELVTRSLYLANTDVKQAMALVRTMTKTRDLHADERLNVLVVRDTAEVVRQVERLLATIDLPEPEVTLAVEVMEVSTDLVDALGLDWPGSVSIGIPGVAGSSAPTSLPLNGPGVRASIANPAFVAQLHSTSGAANLLANPTIRVRNREKAKVQIGSKLPVFSSTTTPSNGAAITTTAITYLDVGLKLDVEPSVQLDGDVAIRLALEVSNVIGQVTDKATGSIAYNLGNRLTTTVLRLKDGETQVLAGLINDEDRRSASGLPGLSEAPLIGKLFGVQGDTRNKTEVVMLITPRIVRPLLPPSTAQATIASGTDSLPGATPLRLRAQASAAVAAAGGRPAATAEPNDSPAAEAAPAAAAPAQLLLSASPTARVGEVISVTLQNRSALRVAGELAFDDQALEPANRGNAATPGRQRFALDAGGEVVFAFRARPGSAGRPVTLSAESLSATDAGGKPADITVAGTATTQIAGSGGPGPAE